MKKTIFLIFVLTNMFSCKESIVDTPKNLIDEDKMVDILFDISILEAIKVSHPQTLQTRGIDSKTYIYKKFKIDSLQFALSDKYYATDIKNYAKMYQKVIDRIDAERTKDSIANIPKTIIKKQ